MLPLHPIDCRMPCVPFCHLSIPFNPLLLCPWPHSRGLHLVHCSFFHLLITLLYPSHCLNRLMKPSRDMSPLEGVYWLLALASPFCRTVREGIVSICGMPGRARP